MEIDGGRAEAEAVAVGGFACAPNATVGVNEAWLVLAVWRVGATVCAWSIPAPVTFGTPRAGETAATWLGAVAVTLAV